jgi:hypothetical protein
MMSISRYRYWTMSICARLRNSSAIAKVGRLLMVKHVAVATSLACKRLGLAHGDNFGMLTLSNLESWVDELKRVLKKSRGSLWRGR